VAGSADIDMDGMVGGRGKNLRHAIFAERTFPFFVEADIARGDPQAIDHFFVEEFAGHGNGEQAAFAGFAAPEYTFGRFGPSEVGLAGGAGDHAA
jgi:hypothetical protein